LLSVSRILKVASSLTPLLRFGLIGGVVLAAVLFPLIGLAGLGVLAAGTYIDNLPAELRTNPPAQVTYVYANDGKTLITQFYEEYRHYVPISEISPNMVRAIVASEDARFYDHHGVDVRGVLRAMVANHQAGGVSQGASTLTMQYVRDIQRDTATTPQQVTDATAQTPARKLREMRLAVQLEKELTKAQILERYLNEAYFGHRAYGIYAAAEVFFSKTPAALTMPEAAMLAGLVKAPTDYDPASSDKTAALQRRNYVIDRMQQLQYITPQTAAAAEKQPITLKLTDPPNDCISVSKQHNDWGFFCDMLKNWWMRQPAFGDSPEARIENLNRGGYRIVTSLDPKIQAVAMNQVTSREPIGSSYALGLVAVQPGTGRIEAAAVNRKYSLDQSHNGENSDSNAAAAGIKGTYPDTVAPLLGGGDMPGYQAGSTFKIFTMTAALEMGMPLNTAIYAPMTVRTNYLASGPGSCGGYWCPHNASAAMTGVQTMWSGFGKSVNTYFVQLEERVGAQRAVQMAERLGLSFRTDVDQLMSSPAKAPGWGSFTLGVADTTPLEMANAYATLAADGLYCAASPVVSITDQAGHTLPIGDPQCHQEVKPQVARAAIDATRCVTGYQAATGSCGGWSTAPGAYAEAGRPMGGKTGTTDDTRAAWFVGVTPDLAAASFIADPDTPLHVAGDGNSQKPVDAVAQTIKLGLAGTPIHGFTPPTRETALRGA
jgi:membrane peptidoglycan carboxypeptidase